MKTQQNSGARAPIPDYPVSINVRDLGAKGDGIADDTEPFRKAITDCPAGGAVFIPDGTYKLTDWLQFRGKSNFALRGGSREKTILWFPQGLQEIHPKSAQTGHGTTTAWSWSGGYLWFENPREVGLENFTMKWPDKQYPGHFMERGYNGINYKGAKDCWIRNVGFYNYDLAMNLDAGATQVSVLGTYYDAYAGRRNGAEGSHHGIQVSGRTTQRNLIMGCEFTATGSSVHELTDIRPDALLRTLDGRLVPPGRGEAGQASPSRIAGPAQGFYLMQAGGGKISASN